MFYDNNNCVCRYVYFSLDSDSNLPITIGLGHNTWLDLRYDSRV